MLIVPNNRSDRIHVNLPKKNKGELPLKLKMYSQGLKRHHWVSTNDNPRLITLNIVLMTRSLSCSCAILVAFHIMYCKVNKMLPSEYCFS